MGHATLIAAKDLRERARDKSVFLFWLLLPLGLVLVLNLVLGDLSGSSAFRYAVVDDDHGPVAVAFVEHVLPAAEESGAVEVRTAATAEEARRLVADGEVSAALLLPADLSTDVLSGAARRRRGGG